MKQCEWQALREQSEWQPVLFVAERVGDRLVNGFVAIVCSDESPQTFGFTPEAELRGGIEDAYDFGRFEVCQWRDAAARMRQRNEARRKLRKRVEIELDLGHIAIGTGAREEFRAAAFEKEVQNRFIERRISGVPVQFPIPVGEIELDSAAHNRAIRHAQRDVVKIRTGFAIPNTELNDLNFVPGERVEFSAEFSCEPAGLQLEFAWLLGDCEQRPLAHA